jgi:GT2 family glycosyltransferase
MVSATLPHGRPDRAAVSAVIVDHHRQDLVVEALGALRAGTRPPDETIVVETDTSSAPSLASAPDRLVILGDNPGYAAACDRGAAVARGEWLLFMNADVTVSPTCLELVLDEAASDPTIGIVTCRLVRPDGSLDHACHRGIPSVLDSAAYKSGLDRLASRLAPWSRALGHYRMAWLDVQETHDVEACSGAFLLIRASALAAVGGWDERYRFYAEDLDLCLRVRREGWRVRYVGAASALHYKGSSSHLRRSSRELTPEERATRQRVRTEIVASHRRFYLEHLEADTPRVLRPLVRAMFALQRRLVARWP